QLALQQTHARPDLVDVLVTAARTHGADDLDAALERVLGEVAADEPRDARDQDAHPMHSRSTAEQPNVWVGTATLYTIRAGSLSSAAKHAVQTTGHDTTECSPHSLPELKPALSPRPHEIRRRSGRGQARVHHHVVGVQASRQRKPASPARGG